MNRKVNPALDAANIKMSAFRDRFKAAKTAKSPTEFSALSADIREYMAVLADDTAVSSSDRQVFTKELDALADSAKQSAMNLASSTS